MSPQHLQGTTTLGSQRFSWIVPLDPTESQTGIQVLHSVSHSISQDQATLSIRVVDLHRQPCSHNNMNGRNIKTHHNKRRNGGRGVLIGASSRGGDEDLLSFSFYLSICTPHGTTHTRIQVQDIIWAEGHPIHRVLGCVTAWGEERDLMRILKKKKQPTLRSSLQEQHPQLTWRHEGGLQATNQRKATRANGWGTQRQLQLRTHAECQLILPCLSSCRAWRW